MNPLEQAVSLVMHEWAPKKLEALRLQAATEPTGIAFDAVRVAGGPRLVVLMCVTKKDQIELVRRAFGADTLSMGDWREASLLDLFARAALGRRVAVTSTGEDAAVALMAADPDSMTKLGMVFTLPK